MRSPDSPTAMPWPSLYLEEEFSRFFAPSAGALQSKKADTISSTIAGSLNLGGVGLLKVIVEDMGLRYLVVLLDLDLQRGL